jgi:hypothetical protein
MRQQLWSVAVVGIVSAVSVGLLAQAPGGSQTPASKPITLSGCIERAPQSEPGGTPATGAMSAKFLLTNATTPATGAVGTTGTTKPAIKYQLDVDDAKVTPHVGHKVEVTGTVQDQPSTANLPGGADPSSASAPKLKVDSVKMVAATCP